jgi:hypothetical protein
MNLSSKNGDGTLAGMWSRRQPPRRFRPHFVAICGDLWRFVAISGDPKPPFCRFEYRVKTTT